ncbi:hypothetical protein AVEN_145130-1 [Araneus ventricosus]|uniref:Uncharacterized protein n=1 Tax=Araneus ventricosus TaxID=182803 RepID=A0A4Y2GPC9_ARAVE|nr:hypothetical protein AVEN_145130-1 [Araneus ventricosus]
MNYFSVIRPPAGQITQPQSCAFFYGDDCMRSILTGGLCRLHVGGLSNGTTLSGTPLGFRKTGQIYYPLRSSCVAPGTSLCGRLCRGKEVGETSQGISDNSGVS